MNLELDHIFILVKPEAEVADALVSLGMIEGTSNHHEGQGTSNRRFYFNNGMLEFLYVRDQNEANNGPGRNLNFPERSEYYDASPFGVILHNKDGESKSMPFEGWKYQPDYFEPPWTFHIGSNSSSLNEPLCIYVPFYNSKLKPESQGGDIFQVISEVKIYTPSISNTLIVADRAERLSIERSDEHLMEITFNENSSGQSRDLRPQIPLVINW